jgi:tetratricopeptide (TPR) repeat protein
VPGKLAHPEPEELAWELEPGTDLVLQLHLVATGKPEQIQASIGFHFTDVPPRYHPMKLFLMSRAIDIAPGQSEYVLEDSLELPVDVEVLAVMPHAHYLGKEMQARVTLPSGESQLLLAIKQWNFNWQSDYQLAKPLRLPKHTTLSMRFTYDNSTNNARNPFQPPKEVLYGPQTSDEMAEFWLQVLPRNLEDGRALGQALSRHTLKISLDQYQVELRRNPGSAEAHNGLAKALLGMNRGTEALREFEEATALNPKLEEPYFYMGYIYRQQARLFEAQHAYDMVVQLNPSNYQAYGNLGLVLLEQTNVSQAAVQFREALRLNPNDRVASRNLAIAERLQRAGLTDKKER